MDFATLPPETNSGRMFAGPGPGSMIRAATAWEGLAAQLGAAAAQYKALKPAVAPPYLDWLDATATQARLAASRLAAAAAAYRSALAAMVPPAVIAANRAQRTSMARRNSLGQSAPAIADLDAEYERMWARDAEAMYAYARASAAAAAVSPFTSPPAQPGAATGTWALTSAPDVVSAGSRLMSTISVALQALSLSPPTPFEALLAPATSSLSRLSSLSAPFGVAITHLNKLNKAAALSALFTADCPYRAWATATAPVAVRRGTVA